jgi:hypothetical protein
MTLLWIIFILGILGVGYSLFTWIRDEINKPQDDNDEIMDE